MSIPSAVHDKPIMDVLNGWVFYLVNRATGEPFTIRNLTFYCREFSSARDTRSFLEHTYLEYYDLRSCHLGELPRWQSEV